MGGRSERGGRSRSRRDRYDERDRGRDERDRREDFRLRSHGYGMPDRSRDGRARHDDARHELRENGRYGKGAFDDRHMERDRNYADRHREEDRYSDRPERDRYASRDDHNERYNLRQSERGRVDRSDRNDRWEEPRGDWGRDWRDEPRERERDHRERERFEREEREREDRERRKRFDQFDPEDRQDRNRHAEHSDRRERRSHQSGHARDTFISERRDVQLEFSLYFILYLLCLHLQGVCWQTSQAEQTCIEDGFVGGGGSSGFHEGGPVAQGSEYSSLRGGALLGKTVPLLRFLEVDDILAASMTGGFLFKMLMMKFA